MTATLLYEKFHNVLVSGGLHDGLRFLNARVPYRFSAIYQLSSGVMRNVYLVDKQVGTEAPDLSAVPLQNSFCQLAIFGGKFVTENAAEDARLDGNPYKDVVGSYVGLPLLGMQGELWGTFCHLDLVPQQIASEEFAFLQRAALLMPRYINFRAAEQGAA